MIASSAVYILEGPTTIHKLSVIWKIGFKLLPTNRQTERKKERKKNANAHNNLLLLICADQQDSKLIRFDGGPIKIYKRQLSYCWPE